GTRLTSSSCRVGLATVPPETCQRKACCRAVRGRESLPAGRGRCIPFPDRGRCGRCARAGRVRLRAAVPLGACPGRGALRRVPRRRAGAGACAESTGGPSGNGKSDMSTAVGARDLRDALEGMEEPGAAELVDALKMLLR